MWSITITTIAVTKFEIGSDLQYTENTRKWKGRPKVFHFKANPNSYPHSDFYVGFAGRASDIIDVAEFFSRPDEIKPPRPSNNLRGAVLTAEGSIFTFEDYRKWIAIDSPYYAIGSGAEFALGALAMGASVKEAIKVASNNDSHTGMGYKIYTL